MIVLPAEQLPGQSLIEPAPIGVSLQGAIVTSTSGETRQHAIREAPGETAEQPKAFRSFDPPTQTQEPAEPNLFPDGPAPGGAGVSGAPIVVRPNYTARECRPAVSCRGMATHVVCASADNSD